MWSRPRSTTTGGTDVAAILPVISPTDYCWERGTLVPVPKAATAQVLTP
jgi:hypothetical protein